MEGASRDKGTVTGHHRLMITTAIDAAASAVLESLDSSPVLITDRLKWRSATPVSHRTVKI